ncbi:hypothetical protein NJO91_14845 [Streptomyces microflavus]|uniref:hypothetical protein n=1 Tax=Streptomyces microflavus TaxID=1919 RepID=UPI0029B8982D|nr:hypothetical protein [Streptomyces microflavus]MDX2404397.1 hypothetical protein [Streptomyces microflavus]
MLGTNGVRPAPEHACAALVDAEHIRAAAAALSATPWPNWFFITLTLYIAALPITAVYGALFAVAARSWRNRTGVALRLDVLPKRATVPLVVGLPVVLVGAAFAFRVTGWPGWLIAASLTGAAVSVGFRLAFIRLHRKTV